MTDIQERLRRIEYLKGKISKLEHFIYCIKDNSKGNYKACTMFYNIETTKKFRIKSIFNFVCGKSEEIIEIPDDLNVPIRDIAEVELHKLEKELELMLA